MGQSERSAKIREHKISAKSEDEFSFFLVYFNGLLNFINAYIYLNAI